MTPTPRAARAIALAFAISLASVLPAAAAHRYVGQGATGDGSGSSTGNLQAIATFNSGAVAGDTALLVGNFTTRPIPARNGTSSAPIVYRNASTSNDRSTVNFGVPGAPVDFYVAGNSSARYLVWRDFSIRGRVFLGTDRAATPMSRIRMTNVRIVDGNFLAYRLDDCKFDSLNLTITSSATRGGTLEFGRADKGADSVWYCSRDTVTNSTFANHSGECMSAVDAPAASFLWCGRDMEYSAIRCTLITTNHYTSWPLRFSRVAQTVRGHMNDVSFYGYFTPGGAGTDEPMTWTYKDGCRFFEANNLDVTIAGSSYAGYPMIDFAQDEGDGTAAQACESIGENVIRNSTFRNLTASTNPIAWYTNATDGDSIAYNVFLAGTGGGTLVHSYARGNGNAVDRVSTRNTVFDHNAFITFCTGQPAVAFSTGGSTPAAEEALKFTNNLFVNMAATAAGRGTHFGLSTRWGSAAVGPVGNDWNVWYVPHAASREQIVWNDGTTRTSAPGAAAWRDLRGANTLDVHSSYGGLVFQDSALATFDAHQGAGSAADLGGGAFAGPYASGTVTTYTITATYGPHGTGDLPGVHSYDAGSEPTYAFTPDAGYVVADVIVDGTSVGAPFEYNFAPLAANRTISVTFTPGDHTITATAGAHGSISPSGAVGVPADADQAFAITPDAGYRVADVLVDGVSQGATTTYEFTSVAIDHTIAASFELDTQTIYASAFSHGSISPTGDVVVPTGGGRTFTITPATGYHVSDVLVDYVSVGPVTSYTFTNVTAEHFISASFTINTYSITASTTGSGAIFPTGTTTNNYGSSRTYHFAPNSGHQLLGVDVDGVTVGNDSIYTFSAIHAAHTVQANFGPIITYTISTFVGAHGAITPAGGAAVTSGGSATFTFTPEIRYRVEDVKVDGTSVGAVDSYTFSSVTGNHTLSVTFTGAAMPKETRSSFYAPRFPRVLLFMTASNHGGGIPPQTYPLVTGDGAINAATVELASLYPLVYVSASALDSCYYQSRTAALAALRAIRAASPTTAIIAQTDMDAGWIGGADPSERDTTARDRFLYDMWKAGAAVGWTAGNGRSSNPSAGADTCTGTRGFLWNKVSGWRGAFFQSRTYGSGSAGSTNCNLNLAWNPSAGVWPVRDSVIAAHVKLMERTDPVTGGYVWDGFHIDLALPYCYPMSGDTVDWTRAGYAGTTSAAFDSAWFAASATIFRRLREHADSLGRTGFIITGNAALGYAHASIDGWTIEDWPNQNTGETEFWKQWRDNWTKTQAVRSRSSNFEIATGLQSHGSKFRQDWPGSAISVLPLSQSDSLCGVRGDTLLTARKLMTMGLATASLVGAYVRTVNTAVSQSNRLGHWYDEWAVNAATGEAVRAKSYTGWLGYPRDHFYNNATTIGTTDLVGGWGAFDTAAQRSMWTLGSNAYGTATFVADTVVAGAALKLQTLKCYGTHVDYSFTVAPKARFYGTSGDTITVSLWARASFERPLWIALQGTSGNDRGSWGHLWLGTEWQPYRLSCVLAASESIGVQLWAGDTTGIVWVDSLKVQKGRFRGGSYLRRFDHGLVIANATPHADTVIAPVRCRRITSRVAPNYNDGTRYPAGAAIPVPAGEALFLVIPPTTEDK